MASGSTRGEVVGCICEGDGKPPGLTYLDPVLKEEWEFAQQNEIGG